MSEVVVSLIEPQRESRPRSRLVDPGSQIMSALAERERPFRFFRHIGRTTRRARARFGRSDVARIATLARLQHDSSNTSPELARGPIARRSKQLADLWQATNELVLARYEAQPADGAFGDRIAVWARSKA